MIRVGARARRQQLALFVGLILRTVIFVLSFLGLDLFVTSPVQSLDTVRIAVSNPNMPNLTVAMAQQKGFFRDENIEAEIIRINPNVAVTALATGDIDYCQLFGAVVGRRHRRLSDQNRCRLPRQLANDTHRPAGVQDAQGSKRQNSWHQQFWRDAGSCGAHDAQAGGN